MVQFTLYTSVDSQWVGVPHLALLEKKFDPSQYETKEISLRKFDDTRATNLLTAPTILQCEARTSAQNT